MSLNPYSLCLPISAVRFPLSTGITLCPHHGPTMWSSTPFPFSWMPLLLSSIHSALHLIDHLSQKGVSDSFSITGPSLNTVSPQWSPRSSLRVVVTDVSLCPQQQLSTHSHCTATVCSWHLSTVHILSVQLLRQAQTPSKSRDCVVTQKT